MKRRHLAAAGGVAAAAALAVVLPVKLASGGGFDLAAAYKSAQPGSTVCVPAGDYGSVVLADDPTKDAGPPVTVAPCEGARPTFSRLELGQGPSGIPGPKHLVVRDLEIQHTLVWEGASDVELRNLKGKGFDVVGSGNGLPLANDVRVVGGEYGPCEATLEGGECTNRMIGTGITVDGAFIHDVTTNDPVRYHVDGIFVRGCSGCVVRGSVFARNDVTNIRVQNCCGLPANRDIALDGNWFGRPTNGDGSLRADGVDVDTATANLKVTGNTFEPGSGPLLLETGSGNVIQGNEMMYTNGPCLAGVSYGGNVAQAFSEFYETLCSSTDRWADPANPPGGSWPYVPPDLSWQPPAPAVTTTASVTTVPTTAPTTTAPATTTAPTTTAPATTTTPTQSPLYAVRFSLRSSNADSPYYVAGYDKGGKVVSSWQGQDRAAAQAAADAFEERIP